MSPLKLISAGVVVVLLVGYGYRRRARVHVPLMLAAFVIDLAVVLYIELDRGAFAAARAKMGPLMVVHITLSTIVLLLYVGQIITGIMNARGRRSRWHRLAGPSLIATRVGNLITSFLVT